MKNITKNIENNVEKKRKIIINNIIKRIEKNFSERMLEEERLKRIKCIQNMI